MSIPPGNYLLQLKQEALANTNDGQEQNTLFIGEIELVIVGEGDSDLFTVRIPRFGLTGSSVVSGQFETGLTGFITAEEVIGKASTEGKGLWLNLTIPVTASYELMGRQLGYEPIDEHSFAAPTEQFEGRLSGFLVRDDKSSDVFLTNAELWVDYQGGGLGLIQKLEIPLGKVRLIDLSGNGDDSEGTIVAYALAGDPCNPDLQKELRQIRVQPIVIRSNSGTDPTCDQASIDEQVDRANEVWGKARIRIHKEPTQFINNTALQRSVNINDLNTAQVAVRNVIRVFFVVNGMLGGGGGGFPSGGAAAFDPTFGHGTILLEKSKVIGGMNADNRYLLAHEMGHIMSLCHPGAAGGSNCLSYMNPGDSGTVMVPATPNSPINTHYNCIMINNAAFTTVSTNPMKQCLTHDIPDHYIRDYPAHQGQDVVPASVNVHAESYIWNRLTNDPGIPSPGFILGSTVLHEQPQRYLGGRPRTNWMFALVETTKSLPNQPKPLLPLRDVRVEFYLKEPGSGAMIGIYPLGRGEVTMNMPITLNETQYQIARVAWTPDSMSPPPPPTHCCMFAVVRSPAEPGPFTSVNPVAGQSWQQLVTRVRNDNDWVQRNLEWVFITPRSPLPIRPFSHMSSPIIIEQPEDWQQDEEVSLQVRVSRTPHLEKLIVHILDTNTRFTAENEGTSTFVIKRPAGGPIYVPVQVEAVFSPEMTIGESVDVDIEPTIRETQMVGYRFHFEADEPLHMINQTLDMALGLFTDVARMTGSSAADELADLHRDLHAEDFNSPARLMKNLKTMRQPFSAFMSEMKEFGFHLFDFDAATAYSQFRRLLNSDDAVDALASYRNFVSRAVMGVYVSRPPAVAFTMDVFAGRAPLTVQFRNESRGFSIQSYNWDFGDGTTSDQANPVHTYQNQGDYAVILTVTTPRGARSAQGAITVREPFEQPLPSPPPKAAFAAFPTDGTAPLIVNFDNQSTGEITRYEWRFGDGATSNEVNPRHVYTVARAYTVTLVVHGLDSDDRTQTQILVSPPPTLNANFEARPTRGVSPLLVTFQNLSTGNIASAQWDFGDGSTGEGNNPEHVYTVESVLGEERTVRFEVRLVVSDWDGITAEKRAVISVSSGGGFELPD